MTKDLGKSATSNAKEARKARQKRLEVRRLRFENLTPTPAAMSKLGSGSGNPPSADSFQIVGEGEDTDGCGGLVFGYVSMMGRRRVMEDAVTVAPPRLVDDHDYTFFAVYDGHGGAKVAEKCRDRMHSYLYEYIEKEKKLPMEKDFDWEKVMMECFRSMEEEIEEECRRAGSKSTEMMMGSTATVVLIGKEEVVVANCGDSRAVLCRGGVALPLTSDHKPDRADEKERIEAAGGKVVNWNGWRVEGVLSTSRSLGDQHLKPYVCSEPEVSIIRRTECDEFLIIGTDGLFDVVGNELACNAVKRCLSGQLRRREARGSGVSDAAALLAELAIAKGSKDNISAVVVQMK